MQVDGIDVVPRLLTVGLAQNKIRAEWNLPEVAASVDGVSAAVAHYGFQFEDWSEPGTTASLRDKIVGLGAPAGDSPSPPTLLYWCGHGQLTDRDFFLITNDSSSASALGGAFAARDLGRLLREEEKRRLALPNPPWRIVIIDTCDSGIGIAEMAEAFPDSSPQATLLIASTGRGAAGAGDFGTHLAAVFNDEFINQTDPIPIREVRRRLEDWLKDFNLIRGSLDWGATLPAPITTISPIATSMDMLAELRSFPEETLAHFFPRNVDGAATATGGAATEVTSLPWQFVGRLSERLRITQWLNSDDAQLAVVGAAGSGKSALLGMVLAATLPDLVAELRGRKPEAWPVEVVPHDARFNVVCHLAGKTALELVTILVASLGLAPTQDINGVIEQLESAGIAPVVLADALNESAEPSAIAAHLRALAAVAGAKVLVGTQLAEPGDGTPDLLQALGNPPVCRIDVDQQAAESFVADQLDGQLPQLHAAAWATEVAGREQPFLYARLAVHEALANPSEDPRGLLDAGREGLFAQAYERIAAANPHSGALLRVLAQARGRGFPRNDGIWAVAASALAGEPIRDPDIGVALETAAPYILVDHEFGQAAFRLANQDFVDFFRSRPPMESEERSVAWQLLRESRILKPLPAYLRTHLPEHLSASSSWDRVRVSDIERMDPRSLSPALTRGVVGSPQLSPLLSAAVVAASAHPDATAAEWPRLLRAARRRWKTPPAPSTEGET